ncbi:MRNIP protein, partial [Alcedo cyanopectus]|nr:MRNIP protein [Ceyx cyanopectus]
NLVLIYLFFFQIYGQGSGLDCRHHVQKLNLIQGEAEEARGWTSRCVEDSVNDSKYISAQCENNSDQQGRAEVSRWSKYLDKDSEDQEDEEDEAGTERQQFCSQRKNTGELKRKHQKSCFSSVVQDCAEENGVFQFAYQAKKWKKCLVPDPEDGDAVSGHPVVLAVRESVEPEDSTQTPAACTKPSKWEKFLLCSDKCSENAARATLSPQEGSRGLGLHSSIAAATAMASRCSEQGGRTLPPGRDFQFNKCGARSEWVASKLPDPLVPSPSFSAEEDASFKEPPLRRPVSGMTETTGGRCCLDSTTRANTLVKCNPRPQPSNSSCEQLFCTGEEFDDDL